MLQEHLCLANLSVVNLAFFLAVRQLIEAGLASHSFQSLPYMCSGPEGTVPCKCVDVDFKRILVILNPNISRFLWLWVWV